MNRLETMLLAVRDQLLPLTRQEVAQGNHVFGGLILDKNTLQTLVAGSNKRMESPLFHGEIDTLNRFFKLPHRPPVKDLIFLASHDPCPMCAASIAWAGFTELWTLFDYEDVADDFAMPVDLIMFRELFGCEGVKAKNPFFTKHSLKKALMDSPEKHTLLPLFNEISRGYAELPVQEFDYPGMGA